MRAAALLLAALLGAGCKPKLPQVRTAAQPDDQEQRLIARNAALPADDDLAAMYSDLDARHFGGKLPSIAVRWEPRLQDVRLGGDAKLTLEGLWGRAEEGGAPVILINAKLRGDSKGLARTLSHEMIHEALDLAGQGPGHGPRFQAELRRLYEENAFEGQPPGEGEKEGLKAWLDQQQPQLKAAWDDIQARRAALKPGASHEQIQEFNDAVRRQNLLAETYNREAMRYNEMLVYPDGLAGDRVALAGGAGAAAERR